MKVTTIIVTRSGSCHVKTLHTILRMNIQCIQKNVQSQIVFVNDDPYAKADAIQKYIKDTDRIFFIDFGIQVDDASVSHVVSNRDDYHVMVFPGVTEGIDWDVFKDKVSQKSSEPTYQMGLNFDTEIGNQVSDNVYTVKTSSARSWFMICKPTLKYIRCRRTGKLKISPKSDAMFENFKESGVKVVAFTGARLTFTYPHECIGNIVNSAGVKAN